MTPDVFLVIGLVLAVLAVTGGLAAWAQQRFPTVALLAGLVALACIWHGHRQVPGGYALADVPLAIYRVVALIRN